MDNYITKRVSGKFYYSSIIDGGYFTGTSFYFTQWYDAKKNKSLFIIDKIMVHEQQAYDYKDYVNAPDMSRKAFFDGKIKINGEVVYTASKSSGNTYVVGTDPDRYCNDYKSFYWFPVRTTTSKNDDGTDAILSLSIEVDHGDDRSGAIRVELVGNSSSAFKIFAIIGDTVTAYTYRSDDFVEGPAYGTTVIESNGNEYLTGQYGGYLRLYGATIQSILSADDTVAGQNCNVLIEPNSEYYYKIRLSCGDWSELRPFTENDVELNSDGLQSAYHGLIPLDVLYEMVDTPRREMEAILWTYLDEECTNPVGDSDPAYFYVSVPSDVIPTITDSKATVQFTDANYNIGEAISNYSFTNLMATAEGIYGSTIQKFILNGAYNAELEGSSLDYSGAVINTSGLKEFTITAVDSRGMKSEPKQYFIQFYQYEKPNIKLFDVQRDSADGALITIRPAWEITSINGKNTSVGTVKFKKKSESAWRVLCEISNNPEDPVSVLNPDDTENGYWDKYISYEFMLVVQDATQNYTEDIKLVPTIKVIMDFKNPETKEGYGGVGIGKTCELENFVEMWLNAKFYNDVYIGDNTLSEYIFNTMCNHVGHITVSKSDFQEYSPILSYDYPYRASILIDGVTADMEPSVTFCFADSVGGNLAPSAVTFDGGVYIYASWVPDNDVVIDGITFWKGKK